MPTTSTRAKAASLLESISSSTGRVERWERRTEAPLIVLAAVFLAAYAAPILDAGIGPVWHRACDLVDWVIWVAFGIDYVIRVGLAAPRGRYVVRHLPDLIILALPFLRPLRLLMLMKIVNRRVAASVHGRIAILVASSSVLLIFCASLAVLDAERAAPGASIVNFGDAIWWAISTVCTVGYGDMVPVTAQGRAVAVFLMLGGIALVGVVTASLASWLIGKIRNLEADATAATKHDLDAVLRELQSVNAQLEELRRISARQLASHS